MAQEFRINSSAIESKINQLLPSQGGSGAGIDFSASTMVIPIVDLTESAEGSNQRQDLQTALSFSSSTNFNENVNATIINTTGYWRIIGTGQLVYNTTEQFIRFIINDGASDKTVWEYCTFKGFSSLTDLITVNYDFIIKLDAGHTFKIGTSDLNNGLAGSFRQIADINGNLT